MKPKADSSEVTSAISVEKMRESDAYTIAHFVESKELMRRAAQGVFDAVDWSGKKIAPKVAPKSAPEAAPNSAPENAPKVAIIAGSGNNGGDGYALAGILADHGIRAQVFRVSEKFSADGLFYYHRAMEKGVPDRLFSQGCSLAGYDIIVDCILGTGFAGIPRGGAAEAIRAINDGGQSGAFVVSVDINSGMNGDTGEAELAVRSDLTVSIGFYKTGMFRGRAPELIGDLVNAGIGITLV